MQLDAVERLPSGALRVSARPTRTGVFTYQTPTGPVRELRHPDDVFDTAHLESFRGVALTDLHPKVPIDPSNWKSYSIGHVDGPAARDGELVSANVIVQDASAIASILDGRRKELSCGYECDHDETPGMYQGETYDRRQRNMRLNHVGIGPDGWGRMGPQASLRLDSAGSQIVGDISMAIKIDGKEYTDPTAAQEACDKLASRCGQAEGRAAAAESATIAAKKLATDSAASIGKRVVARLRVVDQIRALSRAKGVKFDDEAAATSEMGDIELIRAACKALDPSAPVDGASDDFVMGWFTHLVQGLTVAAGDDKTPAPATGDAPPPAAPSTIGGPPKTDSRAPLFTLVPKTNVNDTSEDEYEAAMKRQLERTKTFASLPLSGHRKEG